jgi:hypothetical protein
MKRISCLLAFAAMVFSFGLAHGASQITLDNVNVFSGDSVQMGNPVTWTFRLTNTDGNNITGSTNGFRVWTSNNGYTDNFTPITWDTVSVGWTANYYDGGFFFNPFGVDGIAEDTIGFGGFKLFKPGIVDGFDQQCWWVRTTPSTHGDTLCIDSSFYPPGGAWLWSTTPAGSVSPAWFGPYCYFVYEVPNLPAVFTNIPTSLTRNHCDLFTFQLQGNDPDPLQCDPPGTGAISFSLVNDGGLTGLSVNAAGLVTYSPTIGDVGGPYTITVRVEDACNAGTDGTFDVSFTNQAPTIGGACGTLKKVGKGNTVTAQFTKNNVDCDPGTFYVKDDGGAAIDGHVVSIGATTGLLTFVASQVCGSTYDIEVCYTDGLLEACCIVQIEVLCTEPFSIVIEKTHMTYQGMHEYVSVYQHAGSEVMGGFDFLIAYDASALSFQQALEGDLYAKCGWEYFTYRYGPNGNCGNACPSGMLRVVGIAETNNGPNHPVADCVLAVDETLFVLDFLVTDNRTYECQYVPIRFFWMDCGDNTISNQGGDTLWVSDHVYEFEGAEITDPFFGFPTYFGTQWECLQGGGPDKPVPVQFIDFYNGGVDIACADSIDARGDINLNGISNEIADAVLFSRYFVDGIGVFNVNYFGQVAATDVNADGLTLTVGDLVYLIRIVVGDALPYPKLNPVAVDVVVNGGVEIDVPMAAAAMVYKGEVAPNLLADNMEMKYRYDAAENITRVLVFSMEPGQTFEGRFIEAEGELLSIEMADYNGAPAKVDMVPSDFALFQNFPNPFNPTTTVAFDVAKDVDYTLTVYNVTGQEVKAFSGKVSAGHHEIEIDGSDLSSGIYFYQLNAGNFSDTKKMIMVK